MSIDFNKWNQEFGGKEAVDALKDANNNEYTEVPNGTYVCKLEKLELGESQKGQPMIKGMFRIQEGQHRKQCLFYNQVFCRNAKAESGMNGQRSCVRSWNCLIPNGVLCSFTPCRLPVMIPVMC